MNNAVLEITMKNSKRYTFSVNENVAKAMLMHHKEHGTFFRIADGMGLSLDLKDAVAVKVDGLPIRVDNKPPAEIIDKKTPTVSLVMPAECDLVEDADHVEQKKDAGKRLDSLFIPPVEHHQKAYTGKHRVELIGDDKRIPLEDRAEIAKELMAAAGETYEDFLYRAECKCGADKYYRIPYGTNKYGKCKVCGETVYYDPKRQETKDGEPVRVMTNMYFVEREDKEK